MFDLLLIMSYMYSSLTCDELRGTSARWATVRRRGVVR